MFQVSRAEDCAAASPGRVPSAGGSAPWPSPPGTAGSGWGLPVGGRHWGRGQGPANHWKRWGNYWTEDDCAGLAGRGEGVGLAEGGEGVRPAEGREGEGPAGCYKGAGLAGCGEGVEFEATCLGFPESAQWSVWHKRRVSVSFGSCLSLKRGMWRDRPS